MSPNLKKQLDIRLRNSEVVKIEATEKAQKANMQVHAPCSHAQALATCSAC